MKKLLARVVLALTAAAAPAAASAEQPNALIIHRTDGVSEYFKFDSDLNIHPTETGGILMVHPAITVEYEAADVDYFTYGTVDKDAIYEGDHRLAITAPEANRRDIEITPEAIKAEGVDALELFDTAGRRVRSAAAESSKATLPLSSLPKGIYILRAGSTSMKIKI